MKSLYLKALIFLSEKLFGRFLEGHKTILIGIVSFIFALTEALSDGVIYNLLCTYVTFFCNFTQSQFYLGFLGVMGFLAELAGSKNSFNKLYKPKL